MCVCDILLINKMEFHHSLVEKIMAIKIICRLDNK